MKDRFSLIQKPSFGFCRSVRQYQKFYPSALLFALMLCFLTAPASGQQSISVSSGSYVIRATYDECFTRARQALELEGYPPGRGGEQYYWGGKGANWAIILCEPPGGSRYSFHIFVSIAGSDRRISDAERDKLARRMEQTNSGGGNAGNTGNTGNTGGGSARTIDWRWSTGSSGLNVIDKIGQRFTVRCPPNGTASSVYGTDTYEGSGSSICTAAVHKGLITFQNGGTVTIEILPGQQGYKGSTRNGVTSGNFSAQGFGTFIFVNQPAADTIRLFQKAGGDLSQQSVGIWQRENGSVIEINTDGTGVFREVSEGAAVFGFKPGDVSLTGIRAVGNDALEATLMLRARKDDCPTLAPMPVKASIKVDPSRNSMSLTAQSVEYGGNCRWRSEGVGAINHKFTRIH